MLIFSKLLSLVLSISLIFVSVMAFKGNSFLSNITGSLTQTRVISLYVKKESKRDAIFFFLCYSITWLGGLYD